MIYCCKGCEKRHIRCHSTCEDYNRERKEHEKIKSEYDKTKQAENDICSYQVEQIRKNIKKKGYKK